MCDPVGQLWNRAVEARLGVIGSAKIRLGKAGKRVDYATSFQIMTGSELKALRESFGLSVAKAARQCEVNARNWGRWESGQRVVPDSIVKLLRVMNQIKTPTESRPTITIKKRGR